MKYEIELLPFVVNREPVAALTGGRTWSSSVLHGPHSFGLPVIRSLLTILYLSLLTLTWASTKELFVSPQQ